MYDVKPEFEGTHPDLTTHFARQRQLTLEAIERGLAPAGTPDNVAVPRRIAKRLALQVLDSLEQMWRDGETFT